MKSLLQKIFFSVHHTMGSQAGIWQFLEYLSESRQSRDFRTALILFNSICDVLWSFEINQNFHMFNHFFQMSIVLEEFDFSAGFCKKVIEILLNVTSIILYFFSKMTYIKWIWGLCNTKSSQIKPFCLFSCL